MEKQLNLSPVNYQLLIQYNVLRQDNEPLSEVYSRILSDKNSSPDEQLVARWVREYCDSIPYEKVTKELLLNQVLFVKDVESIQNIPFLTTRFGYKSDVYQPINTKRLIVQLIKEGFYPQSYLQTNTQWRGKNKTLTTNEQESRELQVVRCVDHATLRNSDQKKIFLNIITKTNLTPMIEIRNAHTGHNACFMIISLVDSEFRSFGLRSAYKKDSPFGIRLEHRDLGENYEGLYEAIKILSIQYEKIVNLVNRMQSQYLLEEARDDLKIKIAQLIFGRQWDQYEYDLSYFFDEKYEDRKSLWDRMLFIQEQLYKPISYMYVKDGKKVSRQKKMSELRWTSHQKILGKIFELFEEKIK